MFSLDVETPEDLPNRLREGSSRNQSDLWDPVWENKRASLLLGRATKAGRWSSCWWWSRCCWEATCSSRGPCSEGPSAEETLPWRARPSSSQVSEWTRVTVFTRLWRKTINGPNPSGSGPCQFGQGTLDQQQFHRHVLIKLQHKTKWTVLSQLVPTGSKMSSPFLIFHCPDLCYHEPWTLWISTIQSQKRFYYLSIEREIVSVINKRSPHLITLISLLEPRVWKHSSWFKWKKLRWVSSLSGTRWN